VVPGISKGSLAPDTAGKASDIRLRTTDIYQHADLGIKERGLARLVPNRETAGRYRPPDALLAFLEAL